MTSDDSQIPGVAVSMCMGIKQNSYRENFAVEGKPDLLPPLEAKQAH